jgi:hypothetical protein
VKTLYSFSCGTGLSDRIINYLEKLCLENNIKYNIETETCFILPTVKVKAYLDGDETIITQIKQSVNKHGRERSFL